MKRMTALLLALLMAAGLTVPAFGAEPEPEAAVEPAEPAEMDLPPEAPAEDLPAEAGMDAGLAELALHVKQTLQVDDDYADFTSDYCDGLTPYWSLNWTDDVRSLSVDVRPDGMVLSVYSWDDSGSQDRFYGFDPAFPSLSREEAETEAQFWLERLFTEPETAQIDEIYTVLGTNGNYRISGTVEKNGLPSPVTFALCLDETGLTSFYRSDVYSAYLGELPGAEAAVEQSDAADSLAGAVELELRWVSDGEGGASLQYVPVGPDILVDAQSGDAVDMDALYENMGGIAGRNVYTDEAMAAEGVAADSGAALTEVELSSVENYGSVLEQDELDGLLREIAALGLDGFQLQWCSYAMDGESGGVTAVMRYNGPLEEEELYGFDRERYEALREAGSDLTIWKYITMNAKTGALKSVSTSYPLSERDETVTMSRAVRTRAAENFLAQAAPDQLKKTELCTLKGYDTGNAVTYAQMYKDWFYPENYLSVTVNPSTGTVDAFHCAWEPVQFGTARNIVPAQEAKAAYTGALDVTLGYAAWPVDITLEDNDLYAAYREQGYTYVEELRLGYYYSGAEEVLGVDAVTGEVLMAESAETGAFVYDDLEGVAEAAEIEALGQAGVGFAGGSFQPAAEITQREAAALLLQADGEYMRPKISDDDLLEQAKWSGFVDEENWDPEKTMTRMEFIRMVLGASRYGDGARLLNLEADEGWNVMALALGINTKQPDEVLSRAGAAEILYRFMDRQAQK